jgi:hypothetical protein
VTHINRGSVSPFGLFDRGMTSVVPDQARAPKHVQPVAALAVNHMVRLLVGRPANKARKAAEPDGTTLLLAPASTMILQPPCYPRTLRYRQSACRNCQPRQSSQNQTDLARRRARSVGRASRTLMAQQNGRIWLQSQSGRP